ncbi:MAG: HAMP domain-containing protein [bacterium]|nr:HAMP domain-containing protein [bacterium]MDT8395163.1 HAMP domain-containing protein [bacterium]
MFRQFATKEIINVAMVVTGFTIVCCILLYSFVKADMMKDSVRYEAALSDTILRSMRYAMLQSDHDSIDQMMLNIGAQEPVKYARIFKCTGVILHSSNIEEIGTVPDRGSPLCARCHTGSKPVTRLGLMDRAIVHTNENKEKILYLMTPIFNDPDCSSAACHFHPEEKQLLGTLDMGLSQEKLMKSLAMLRLRLVIFCVMILFLTVGGVTALLWRNVMQPLRGLVDYASECCEGRIGVDIPRGSAEIERLGELVQVMALERRGAQLPGDEDGTTDNGNPESGGTPS